MNHYVKLSKTRPRGAMLAVCLLALLALVIGSAPLDITPVSAAPESPFFNLAGTLAPGASINPVVPIFGSPREFNFSLTITGGGPADFTIQNAGGQQVWSGMIEAGETVWGGGTLTVGQNPFTLLNTNATTSSDFDLTFFDLPVAPYTWAGQANATGLNSQARVTFPSDGLYTFDLDVTGGQYQFYLNNNHIQKTVTTSTSVTFFVPAGTHDLTIVQDTTGSTGWQVAISDVGALTDSLPYNKSGMGLNGMNSLFQEEWLPINLSTAAQVNLELIVGGSFAPDNLMLEVFDAGPTQLLNRTVISGETLWATLDLPAGTSLIHLVADGANVGLLDYDLTLYGIPTTDYTWTGVSNAAGLNSHIRLDFPTDGLYTFDLDVAFGRYQFMLDSNYILKTAETDTSVTYFVSAGTHDLSVDQDMATGASWSVDIALDTAANDMLPYAKSGGNLGGTANDFVEEWLPVALDNAQTVNLSIETTGNVTDSFTVEVYGSSSPTPTQTIVPVLGTEKVWSDFPLQAGVNRLHIMANGSNQGVMTYDLVLEAVPADTNTWDGLALAGGRNSSIMVDFPAAGMYRFEIQNDTGFANLLLDDDLPFSGNRTTVNTSYDVAVTAGMHEIAVVQDTSFPVTDWSASVMPITSGDSFFHFTGALAPGETVMPQYPANGNLDFNFALMVTNGEPVNLTITDGSGTPVWTGDAARNEVLWGTETLTAGLNGLELTNNGATSADVDLTLYYLPTTDYDWQGMAAAGGLNSHIRVNFPSDGLYSFNYDVNSGAEYQFLVDSQYIQKTVEMSGTVAYYVPAGTHDLYIDQDTQGGMVDWSLSVVDTGVATDTLPYQKSGGPLSGGSDFVEEWLPLNLAADAPVNVALTLAGNAADSLDFAVGGFNVTVYGGETYWTSLDLTAGTTLFHLAETVSNTSSLDYSLAVYALPTLPYTWDGMSDAVQGTNRNSSIRIQFPDDGLYTFDLGVDNGRYQFFLDNEYIQKTAEADTSVTYYIPAGLHDLSIVQDSTQGADWDVGIAQTAVSPDALPYQKMGGALGGGSNDFDQEWMPLFIGAAAEANLKIAVTGSISDSVELAVVDSASATILDLQPIYGGETFWSTFAIPADGVRLYLLTDASNAGQLNYDLSVDYLPQISGIAQDSYNWDGASAGNGLNSEIRVDTPVNGDYHVEVNMPVAGFVTLFVDGAFRQGMAAPGRGFFYEFDVPLTAGLHSFRTEQDATPMTDWIITVTLTSAAAPQVTAVNPVSVSNSVSATITVMGSNFMPGGSLEIDGPGNPVALAFTFVSANEVTAVVPAGLAFGNYDVTWVNPDDQSATLTDGLFIFQVDYTIYLPILVRP